MYDESKILRQALQNERKGKTGMEKIRVESGDMRTIGYDESVQTLEIEFHQGGTYQYYDVPKKIYDGFIKYALSHDDYHARYIKNRYRHKKIR